MPNACSRVCSLASAGRYLRFCSSLPCLRSVPIVYICAWALAALPPERLISSRMTAASATLSPDPPYSVGMSAASHPALVSASTNFSVLALAIDLTPVDVPEIGAELPHGGADVLAIRIVREVHLSPAATGARGGLRRRASEP